MLLLSLLQEIFLFNCLRPKISKITVKTAIGIRIYSKVVKKTSIELLIQKKIKKNAGKQQSVEISAVKTPLII